MRVDVLDDEFRPILERVIAHTDASTCHALRATCRRLHTTIDRLLFRHVSLVFKSVTVTEGEKRRLVDGVAVMYRRLPPKPEPVEVVVDQESVTSDATSSEAEDAEAEARESENDDKNTEEDEKQAQPIINRDAHAEHAGYNSLNRDSRVDSSSAGEHGQHVQETYGHGHDVHHHAQKRHKHHSGHHEYHNGRPEHHSEHHDTHALLESELDHHHAGHGSERDGQDGQMEGGSEAGPGADCHNTQETDYDEDKHCNHEEDTAEDQQYADGKSKDLGEAEDGDASADSEPTVAGNLLPPRRHLEYRHSLDSHPLRRLLEQNGYKAGKLDLHSEAVHGFYSEHGHEYHSHEYHEYAQVHALDGQEYESAGHEDYSQMDNASDQDEGSECTDKSSLDESDQGVDASGEKVADQDAEAGSEVGDGDVVEGEAKEVAQEEVEEETKEEVAEAVDVEEAPAQDPPMRMETFEYVRLPILPFPFVEEAEEPTPAAVAEPDLAVAMPTLALVPPANKPRSIAQRVKRAFPRWPCASADEFDDRHANKLLLPAHQDNGYPQQPPMSPSRMYDLGELERPLPPLPEEKGAGGPNSDSASALIPAAPTPASAAESGSTGAATPKISRASLKDSWERALEYARAVDLHGEFNPQDIDSYWAPGGRLRSLLTRSNADVVRDLRDVGADCVVASEVWTCWIAACPFAPRDPDAEELDMGDADEPTPQGDPTLILKPPRAAYRLVINLPWHPTAAVRYCRLGALLASAEVERVVENGGELAIVFHRAQPPNPDMLDPDATKATKPYGYPGFLKGLAAVLGYDDEYPGDPGEGNGSIITFVNLDIIQPDEIGAVAVPVGGVRAESPPEGFPLALWYMCLGLERHVRKRNVWRGRVFHSTMMEWCSSDEDAMLQLGRPPHPETALAGCLEEDDACPQVCGQLGQINL